MKGGAFALIAMAAAILSARRTDKEDPKAKQDQSDSKPGSIRGKRIDLPVTGVISSVPGDKRSHGLHEGIDIKAPAGSIVRAWGDGKVERVIDGRKSDRESSRRAGLWIDVSGDDGNTHRYLHLGMSKVSAGMRVKRYQEIGTVEEDHLHFEIRKGHSAFYGTRLEPNV